ncbi:MAG: hypothetical protein K1X79_03405 [Oligoflexia bacterium]|nr:hypothetical protein [Oligoflexia bacterium]
MKLSFAVFYFALVALCALQRLYELKLSTQNQMQLRKNGFARLPEQKVFGVMLAVHVLWFPAMLLEFMYAPLTVPNVLAQLALGLFALAQALRFWVIVTLREHWNIAVMGGGVNLSFVTNGPYAWIRHPNYLAVIVELACLPLAGGALRTALAFSALNAIVLWRRMAVEEQQLMLRQGYAGAMANKARLVPGIW